MIFLLLPEEGVAQQRMGGGKNKDSQNATYHSQHLLYKARNPSYPMGSAHSFRRKLSRDPQEADILARNPESLFDSVQLLNDYGNLCVQRFCTISITRNFLTSK